MKHLASDTESFIHELKNEVLAHPVMRHPFWEDFRRGGIERARLRTFALHYYHHVLRTRLYDAAVLARTPYEGIQSAIASVLWDEYGEGDPHQTHPAQFRKLLRALDLHETDWDSLRILPELEMYADVHYRLCSEYDVWVGLGVVGIAMELPIPRLYEHLVQGFKKSGLEEDDIEFFVRHGPMDVHHADLLIGSLTSQLHDDKDREALQAGARRSMDARFILMDGLYRVVFK